jgi:hypothetical protein
MFCASVVVTHFGAVCAIAADGSANAKTSALTMGLSAIIALLHQCF